LSDLYVVTDADGQQHHDGRRRTWPLPARQADGGWSAGAVVEPDDEGAPVLFDMDQLLEDLGQCIFVAERVADTGAAHLCAGTSWSEKSAASFALDCVAHILQSVPGSAEAELPGGGTLGAIIASARGYLASGTGDDHKLGFVSRLATARRLRRDSTAIGDAAFAAAVHSEGENLDVLSDPAWETLAAARDAVLAAVEAVRHVALPFLVDRETRRYEAREEHKAVREEEVDTPWGRFPVGGGGAKYVPSWVAARDAAERARQAVTDLGGAPAGATERAWQVARLGELLKG